MKSLLLLIFLAFSISGFGQSSYQKSIEDWRKLHEAEVGKDDGYLSLAGLFWLKEGINTIGAGKGFDVMLADSFTGGKFGEINFRGEKAYLKTELDYSGPEIELTSDANGAKPNIINIGSQSFFLIKRQDKYAIRLRDKKSQALREFRGLMWYSVNKAYRIEARFEAFAMPKEVLIPNILGGNFKMKSPGILKFKLAGKAFSLMPVEEGGKLFIIFRDPTSKKETYGAGRFLYADMPKDGKVVLDFNKAENPPCAFTGFATCPLPPQQNRLTIAIRAGEKRYLK